MAEPTNTPMPASTPVPASTPRSGSPARPIPIPSLTPSATSLTLPLRQSSKTAAAAAAAAAAAISRRPIVLHIGDPVKYNPHTYAEFSSAFEVVRPSAAERERGAFMRALREQRWGDFSAIFRPFWGSGGEMGRWDAELVGLLPESVRVFASAGAGFDWADTKVLGERGIIYCNSGLAAAEAVADFAVAMVISTFRHLPWCMNAATLPFLLSSSSSSSSAPAESEIAAAAARRAFQSCHALATAASHNPRGHVLGLIGFGNVGQQIAAKLGHPATFGMRIAYHDVVRKSASVEAALGATFHPTLDGLLGVADCVVLCTPASPDGRPIVTAEALGAMRRGARFVNIARGSLVDEEALADALEAGQVGAAALDVHAEEPAVNRRLVGMALGLEGDRPGTVMLTCHNAGGTVETHVGFEELSMRNVLAVLQGREAVTPVNLQFLVGGS
ncbi:D-isomer specific 2-hydroxyacid dehydrogenase [Bombardia bombarda]|uniref:D-isomer specific 2-hydroxyacid dehydrogenase n=1 Tax=Bombardia bombarda TaxID=252184 RepID=A0AA40CFX0_9PEZI|nr:D-isomer specific 2-hydroxyacid dehydrogenase [Bombardia bombarda]